MSDSDDDIERQIDNFLNASPTKIVFQTVDRRNIPEALHDNIARLQIKEPSNQVDVQQTMSTSAKQVQQIQFIPVGDGFFRLAEVGDQGKANPPVPMNLVTAPGLPAGSNVAMNQQPQRSDADPSAGLFAQHLPGLPGVPMNLVTAPGLPAGSNVAMNQQPQRSGADPSAGLFAQHLPGLPGGPSAQGNSLALNDQESRGLSTGGLPAPTEAGESAGDLAAKNDKKRNPYRGNRGGQKNQWRKQQAIEKKKSKQLANFIADLANTNHVYKKRYYKKNSDKVTYQQPLMYPVATPPQHFYMMNQHYLDPIPNPNQTSNSNNGNNIKNSNPNVIVEKDIVEKDNNGNQDNL